MRRIVLSFVLLFCLFCAPAARADLGGDAERLVKRWSGPDQRAERLSPVFLMHGQVRVIAIDAAAEPAGDSECLTVALLATRSADFVVSVWSFDAPAGLPATRLPPVHPPIDGNTATTRSSAGAAVLSRCGAARQELSHLAVELRSNRAVVEVVVAHARQDVAPLETILPERGSGPIAPRGNPGFPPAPGPLADRRARALLRARADGAARVTAVSMTASQNGTGLFSLALAEGCHRVEVLAEAPEPSTPAPGSRARQSRGVLVRPTDIDVEARASETGRVLARDRSDAADGRLDFCLGARATVEVRYIGAPGAVTVTAQDAAWPIPDKVPSQWGTAARAGFAAALRKRRAPEPATEPIFQTLGVHGQTAVPFDGEPGKCYLAAVALIRGEAQRIRLAAAIGGRYQRDESVERPESASMAFCTQQDSDVLLTVEARGSSVWWALVVWPMGGSML